MNWTRLLLLLVVMVVVVGKGPGGLYSFLTGSFVLFSQIVLLKISAEAQGPRSCWAQVLAASGCCWVSRGQV